MNKSLKYLLDFAVMMVVYILKVKRWKAKGRNVVAANTLMYLYLTGVLYVTLMPIVSSLPFITNHPYTLMNLIPFDDFINNRGDTVRQIVLNMVMMIPFGFLLPICNECNNKKYGFVQCLLFSAGLSICIELLQPLINSFRSADITDVITNTFGGLIGYLIFLILRPVIFKLLKKK